MLIKITHKLDHSESKKRVERLLNDLKVQYSNFVEESYLSWNRESADVAVRIKKMSFHGVIEIKTGEVLLNLKIPLAAAIFKGQIKDEILKYSQTYFE